MIELARVFMILLSTNSSGGLDTKILDGGWTTIDQCKK